MKARNITTFILMILLVLVPVQAITLKATSVDLVTDADISPSTITINGLFTEIGTPTVTFNNVAEDALHSLEHSATGYIGDIDYLYFDSGLSSCTGPTCSLSTGGFFTFCTDDTGVYDCSVSNNGEIQFFFYNPSTDIASFVNYLDPTSNPNPNPNPTTPPPPGSAPLITATATPLSGLSPLVVTFTNNVVDDGQVVSVTWLPGDGQAITVNPLDSISHTYYASGTYNTKIVAIDNDGFQSEQTFTIVVDGNPNPPVGNLPYDDSHVFFVTIASVDLQTDADINPSTITMGGAQQTGTPWANFPFVRSNSLYSINNEASGYTADEDVFFFDFQLPTCSGTSCDLVSRDVFGNAYNTHCDINPINAYDCSVTNNGITNFFFYNPATNKLAILNYLVSDSSQTGNQPPVVTFSATPTAGDSPLDVTFNWQVTDNGAIERVVLYFGDDQTFETTQAFGTTTHTFNGGAKYDVLIAAWDTTGELSTQSLQIVVNGAPNGNQLTYNAQVQFELRIASVDANTDADINPSTISFNGAIQQGTPWAVYNTNSNAVFEIRNDATGYFPDVDHIYLDFQLPTCTGPTCDLASRNIFGNVFETHCIESQIAGTYDCTLQSNGQEQEFFYTPSTNRAAFVNYLVSDSIIDNPADITVDADPTSGIAPLDVTFDNAVSDLDGVNTSMWFFGDGTSVTVQAIDQVQHTYEQTGIYEAQFVTWDNNQIASTANITITATGLNGEVDDGDDDLSLFVRSIQIPQAYETHPGDAVQLYLTFENDGDTKLKHVKAIASIPELGLRTSQGGQETLYEDEDRRETLVLQLPYDIEPGYYWVRIQLSADETDRIVHREIRVVEPDQRPSVGLVV